MEPGVRLRVSSAQCDSQGRLLASAYLDLRDRFHLLASPHGQPELPQGSDSDGSEDMGHPGTFEQELSQLQHLQVYSDRRNGRGWRATHPSLGQQMTHNFSKRRWQSWRLCFLLAALQRDVWAQHSERGCAKLLAALFRRRTNDLAAVTLLPAAVPNDQAALARPPAADATTPRTPPRRNRGSSHAADSAPTPPPAAIAAAPSVADELPVKRLRLTSKGHHTGLSSVALVLFRQLDPLFRCWLGCPHDTGVNPSPFDLHALFCAHRLFGFLHRTGPPERRRLYHKQAPLRLLTPLEESASLLAVSLRGNLGLSEAVSGGDLDAMRFQILVREAVPEEALLEAVQFSQPALVRFLLSSGVDCNGPDNAPIFLHEALAVWMGRSGGNENAQKRAGSKQAMDVVHLLAAKPGADLEAAMLPHDPEVGAWKCHHFYVKNPRRRGPNLPFLQRGDSPLMWAMRAHAHSIGHEDSAYHRLRAVVECLLQHGADPKSLGRRQQKSLYEMVGKVPEVQMI